MKTALEQASINGMAGASVRHDKTQISLLSTQTRPQDAPSTPADRTDQRWEWLHQIYQGSAHVAGSLDEPPADIQGASQSMCEDS